MSESITEETIPVQDSAVQQALENITQGMSGSWDQVAEQGDIPEAPTAQAEPNLQERFNLLTESLIQEVVEFQREVTDTESDLFMARYEELKQ